MSKPAIKVIVTIGDVENQTTYELESVWSQEVEELCTEIWQLVDHFFSTKLRGGKAIGVYSE